MKYSYSANIDGIQDKVLYAKLLLYINGIKFFIEESEDKPDHQIYSDLFHFIEWENNKHFNSHLSMIFESDSYKFYWKTNNKSIQGIEFFNVHSHKDNDQIVENYKVTLIEPKIDKKLHFKSKKFKHKFIIEQEVILNV